MDKTVIGVFNHRMEAEDAISKLEALGYEPKDFSIIMKDKYEDGEGTSIGANVTSGVASGATTGGVLGGIAGLLIGIGAIAIPGVGAILIGGPLAVALGLTGAAATTVSGAVTGALAGGLVGGLMGLGLSEDDAKYYESRVNEGAILVAVPALGMDNEEIHEVFENYGAEQVRTLTDKRGRYEERLSSEEERYTPSYYNKVRKKR